MTLIAAIRTKEGVAICADSQETSEHEDGSFYRRTVQKIAPIVAGHYQIAIAGSGDADLIEAFIILADRKLKSDTSEPSVSRVLLLIEEELDKFYAKHVTNGGAAMKLFIAAHSPLSKEYEVWVSEKQYLRPLKDAELIGWEEELYWVAIKRLYRPGMSLMQAVLAAVHVLVIGEESSNYIKGPFSLTVVRENGIWAENSDYVDILRDRLSKFESYTNQILLACADTSLYSHDLETAIVQFAVTAKELHKEQIDEAVQKMAKMGLMMNDSICKLPLGLLIEVDNNGSAKAVHDVNGIQEMMRRVNEAVKGKDNSEGDES
ncbi:MAG TPA: hypothetical protein VGU67_06390 [Edaphobacter sp.]|nr:hypothetical protein [Edaphobacter sp.]